MSSLDLLRAKYRRSRLPARTRAVVHGPASPTTEGLVALRESWTNAYGADIGYLRRVADLAATTTLPVLECGSGLTTVVLAATAWRTQGVPVWTLEHDRKWFDIISDLLEQVGQRPDGLTHAPLAPNGWYDAPLEHMPRQFGLAVVDGPPSPDSDVRSKLMDVMGDRLAGATVLLDDVDRPGEQRCLERWVTEWDAEVEIVSDQGRSFAQVTVPTSVSDHAGLDGPGPDPDH